ncbi:hypothetical protein [uncultured Jatrophihabitans sp.]|uniref:hypothetical protein n=1 Tax=uncultured Jatrophihabitans sp. TaxID=1610747 RepID=UPI0035CC2EA7
MLTDEIGEVENAWWREVAQLTFNAATLEWLVRRLMRGEAGVSPRLAAVLLPQQLAQALDAAVSLTDYSIPVSARSQVVSWLEQVREVIGRRDALMTGFAAESLLWTVAADGRPAGVRVSPAAPPWPLVELVGVNAALRAAIAAGRVLLDELGGAESRFADLMLEQA